MAKGSAELIVVNLCRISFVEAQGQNLLPLEVLKWIGFGTDWQKRGVRNKISYQITLLITSTEEQCLFFSGNSLIKEPAPT